jgi:hypothetical protein
MAAAWRIRHLGAFSESMRLGRSGSTQFPCDVFPRSLARRIPSGRLAQGSSWLRQLNGVTHQRATRRWDGSHQYSLIALSLDGERNGNLALRFEQDAGST